ncbi:hypothetical protein EPUL_000911, partial [Erysiphe pulchra]
MASKPKRKRSRPSDWWAVQSESSIQVGNGDNHKQIPNSTQTLSSSKRQHQEGHQGNFLAKNKINDQIRKASGEDSDHQPISKKIKTTPTISSERIERQPNARTRKIDRFSEQNLGHHTNIENPEDELEFQDQINYEFNDQELNYLNTTLNRTGNETNLKRVSELEINSNSDSEQSSCTSILEIESRENHIESFDNNDR